MYNTSLLKTIVTSVRNMCTNKIIDAKILETTLKNLAPPLLDDKHKGQAGRIGVIGGSLEYTGAPYFASVSALKVGADLVHVFCAKDAASVIKSYSPELIVHPLLDDAEASEKIEPWLERLHVVVIGPGLGREANVFSTVEKIINFCRTNKKPLVIDADGLFLIANKRSLIKDYPGVILTPNRVEYTRLFDSDKGETCSNIAEIFGNKCVILKKGQIDEIFDSKYSASCNVTGSGRRCGGQGDLLAGSLAVFYYWALQCTACSENSQPVPPEFLACYAACTLTRKCNAAAFKRLGRSMTTTNMIEEIGPIFNEYFERK